MYALQLMHFEQPNKSFSILLVTRHLIRSFEGRAVPSLYLLAIWLFSAGLPLAITHLDSERASAIASRLEQTWLPCVSCSGFLSALARKRWGYNYLRSVVWRAGKPRGCLQYGCSCSLLFERSRSSSVVLASCVSPLTTSLYPHGRGPCPVTCLAEGLRPELA